MRHRWQILLVTAVFAIISGTAATKPCAKVFKADRCEALKTQLDCISAFPEDQNIYTIKLDCDQGLEFECTGLILNVKGQVKIRGGSKCSRDVRPVLKVNADDKKEVPLINVGGLPTSSLDMRFIDMNLGEARGGMAAIDAASLKLHGVNVFNGVGAMVEGTQRGGALYIKNTVTSITQGSLYKNSADLGGAIYYEMDQDKATALEDPGLRVQSVDLVDNTATVQGGAIFNTDGIVSVYSGSLTGNEAQQGGAIYSQTTRTDTRNALTLGGSVQVLDNTAISSGGGVYLHDTRARLAWCTLRRNKAQYGGGVYARTSGHYISNADEPALTVYAGIVSENEAFENGGGMYLVDTRSWITTNTIRRNKAGNSGGAIFAQASRQDKYLFIRLYLNVIDENMASQNGGGMRVQDVPTIIGSTGFVGNIANKNGGGLFFTTTNNQEPILQIQGSRFRRNTAVVDGGAAFIMGLNPTTNPSATMELRGTPFNDNSAVRGGALYLQDFRAVMTGSTFTANEASIPYDGIGGGIFFRATSAYAFTATTLDMESVSIVSNKAGTIGGGVYFVKESVLPLAVSCKKCEFKDNNALRETGSAFMSVISSGASGQLSIDLSTSSFLGIATDAAICGSYASLQRMAPPTTNLIPLSGLITCQNVKKSSDVCNDFCFDDVSDTAR